MTSKIVAAATLAALAICILTLSANAGDDTDAESSPDATIGLTNFQAAATVVGQPDFSHKSSNQGMGGPAADTISAPYGNQSVGSNGVLYLGDYSNQRVLGFLTFPAADDASANFVLGQPDLNTRGKGDAADQFGGPETTVAYKKMLFVDDYSNSRVLIWKNAPTANQAAADLVVGQAGFGSGGFSCSATGMNFPETVEVAGGKLLVGDSSNNRVLIWKKIPKANGTSPSIVLGQTNLTTCVKNNNGSGTSGATSANNLDYPAGIWSDGKRLVVADGNNNRVLIWKKFPKKSFQKADIVLGQPDLTSNVKDNDGTGVSGAPSAKNMYFPYIGVYSNGTQLFVTDNSNSRILIWNHFPTHNFTPADVVLGQPSFTCGVSDNDGTGCTSGASSAKNLNSPTGIYQFKNHLIVTDNGDNRYLIF